MFCNIRPFELLKQNALILSNFDTLSFWNVFKLLFCNAFLGLWVCLNFLFFKKRKFQFYEIASYNETRKVTKTYIIKITSSLENSHIFHVICLTIRVENPKSSVVELISSFKQFFLYFLRVNFVKQKYIPRRDKITKIRRLLNWLLTRYIKMTTKIIFLRY